MRKEFDAQFIQFYFSFVDAFVGKSDPANIVIAGNVEFGISAISKITAGHLKLLIRKNVLRIKEKVKGMAFPLKKKLVNLFCRSVHERIIAQGDSNE